MSYIEDTILVGDDRGFSKVFLMNAKVESERNERSEG